MGLQILRIDGKRVFKLPSGVRIFLLEKINPPKFIAHHAIARISHQHTLQFRDGFVVPAFFLQVSCIKIICPRKLRFERKRLIQNCERARSIAFLRADTANIYPAVGVCGIGFRGFCECCFGSFKVVLEK